MNIVVGHRPTQEIRDRREVVSQDGQSVAGKELEVKIVVVGAGLSGLVAARERADAGDDVTILEARDRVGGRLWTLHGGLGEGQYAELGAETMYEGHEKIMALTEKLDLTAVACGYFDAVAPPMLFRGCVLDEADRRAITGWLNNAYNKTPPELFENLEAWSNRLQAPRDVKAFLTAYAQYTPVTSLRNADALEFRQQLVGHGRDSYRIIGGNDLLAKRLAENLDVRLGQRVDFVDWSGPQVRVETESEAFVSDKVVIAIPGPLTSEMGFCPPLPAEKARALAELTYGTAAKVVVQYEDRASIERFVGSGAFTDGIPPWIVVQSVDQDRGSACVSSLLGGDAEPPILDKSSVAEFDDSVARLTGSAIANIGWVAHSWTRDPLSRVVVRAPIGDQRTRVLPDVQRPLGEKVYFAGEHTDNRVGPGGLEGATRSGYRVASELG